MKLFTDFGRRLPSDDDRVFGPTPSFYYKLKQPDINYDLILKRAKKYNLCKNDLSTADFKSVADSLLNKLKKMMISHHWLMAFTFLLFIIMVRKMMI